MSPEIDGWKMNFLFGMSYFPMASLVSGRVKKSARNVFLCFFLCVGGVQNSIKGNNRETLEKKAKQTSKQQLP